MIRKDQNIEFRDILDGIFAVSSEAYKGEGEDSFCCSCSENAALIGVFDGCGGLGARQYEHYEGHTGAYIASRLVSGAVYDWFQALRIRGNYEYKEEELDEKLSNALGLGERKGGNTIKLRGSMVRDFPTTASFVLAKQIEGNIVIDAMWAGDSRIYLLDFVGLSPLSIDDTDSKNAFEDLRNDPVQTNVLSSDGNFMLHRRSARINGPMAVIAATDGYFAYWHTPMEFEYFLLDTLDRAKSSAEWKKNLHAEIQEVAGDDATLAVMLFYFGSFSELKRNFKERYKHVKEQYIKPLSDDYSDEKARQLWQEYRKSYERYMK